jgi:Flp pilus assembly protein TadD
MQAKSVAAGRLLDEARIEFRAGRFAQAAAHCRAVLAMDPNNGEALHILGSACYRLGRLDEAVEFLGGASRIRLGTKPKYASTGRRLLELESECSIRQR